MDWLQILSQAVLLTVVTFVLKRFHERALARLTNELHSQRMKEQIRFSLIHQKRADVIGIVYGRLIKASRLLKKLVEPQLVDGIPLPEKKEEARLAIIRTRDYYDEHRIYLDKSVCDQIEDFLNGMLGVFSKFNLAQQEEKYSLPDPTGQWMQSWMDLEEKLLPVKEKLEDMFRQALEADATPDDKSGK